MKIALFGTGRMGRTIVYMIKQLGDHTIHTWDSEERGVYGNHHTTCNMKEITSIDGQFDLAISALPYHLNLNLAITCMEKKIPYCDLGGSVPVSDKINEAARDNGSTVFTDLGLAPGWANIMGEEAFNVMPEVPDTIKMRCGGLPVNISDPHRDPFNYSLTWSTEGLYNEYADQSEILRDGKIITIPSLTERELVKVGGFPPLEAFTTSGGASHTLCSMRERGVKNCSYKTLRYSGHLDLISYFLHNKKFNDEQMASLFSKDFKEDVVIVGVEALGDSLTYNKTHMVYSKEGYSAMQRATAGGLVAAIFAVDLANERPLAYKDVCLNIFNKNIKELKII